MLEEINAKLDRLLGVPIKSNYAKWTPEKLSLLEMMYYEGSSVVDIIEVMRTEFGDERSAGAILAQISRLESALEYTKDVPIIEALRAYKRSSEPVQEFPNKTDKKKQEDKPIMDMLLEEPPF